MEKSSNFPGGKSEKSNIVVAVCLPTAVDTQERLLAVSSCLSHGLTEYNPLGPDLMLLSTEGLPTSPTFVEVIKVMYNSSEEGEFGDLVLGSKILRVFKHSCWYWNTDSNAVTVQLNINQHVKVKLLPKAIEILRNEHEEMYARLASRADICVPEFIVHKDEEGFTQFQLHQFMSTFGPHIEFTAELGLFEDNLVRITGGIVRRKEDAKVK